MSNEDNKESLRKVINYWGEQKGVPKDVREAAVAQEHQSGDQKTIISEVTHNIFIDGANTSDLAM
ncbi:MAG: hypothetical protein OEY94_06380 [Alphaproteobacteria bacterium]|nr:hypothetical protein [Alphaproteobacteria bacterium]